MGAVQTANPPSFESVWAVLDRVSKKQEELVEIQKELAESQKATDRQMQKTDSELGKLSKRMGEVVEFMVAPNLREKFKEFGFNFSQSSQKIIVSDKEKTVPVTTRRQGKIGYRLNQFLLLLIKPSTIREAFLRKGFPHNRLIVSLKY